MNPDLSVANFKKRSMSKGHSVNDFNLTPPKSPSIFDKATPVRTSFGFANKENSVSMTEANDLFGAPGMFKQESLA